MVDEIVGTRPTEQFADGEAMHVAARQEDIPRSRLAGCSIPLNRPALIVDEVEATGRIDAPPSKSAKSVLA